MRAPELSASIFFFILLLCMPPMQFMIFNDPLNFSSTPVFTFFTMGCMQVHAVVLCSSAGLVRLMVPLAANWRLADVPYLVARKPFLQTEKTVCITGQSTGVFLWRNRSNKSNGG